MTTDIMKRYDVMSGVPLLVLLTVLAHSRAQQGQQFYFPQQQQQQQPVRYVNNFQQPYQQVFRPTPEPVPQRIVDYRRPDQYDQDLKTSDLSLEYQRGSQFQYQRPFGFPQYQQLSTPAPHEPYSFQDQRFGHFPTQVTPRPPAFYEPFSPQPPQQSRPQLFQQQTLVPPAPRPTPAPVRQVKEPARQVQLSARFPSPVQADLPLHLQVPQSLENHVIRKPVRNGDRGRVRATTEAADTVDAELQQQAAIRGNRLGNNPTRTRTTIRREKPLPPTEEPVHNVRPSEIHRSRRPTPSSLETQFQPEVSYERHEHKIITTSNSVRTTSAPRITNYVTQRPQHRLRVPFEDEAPTTRRGRINTTPRSTSTTTTTTTTTTPAPTSEEKHDEAHGGVYPFEDQEEEEELEEEHSQEDEELTSHEESVEESQEIPAAQSPTEAPDTSKQLASPSPATQNEPTESWVIVASVQTSRSVSGARFLPAGIVSQKVWNDTLYGENGEPMLPNGEYESVTPDPVLPNTTITPSSTESIIDKLDRVQSELSSGIFSGGFRNSQLEVLTVMPMPEKDIIPEVKPTTESSTTTTTTAATTTTTTTTTTTAKPSAESEEEADEEEATGFVRKFSPAAKRTTTTAKPKKSSLLDNLQFDDLTGLLPAGFKPRSKKPTTTAKPSQDNDNEDKPSPARKQSAFKPKSPKKRPESSARASGVSDQNKIVFQEDISALLPPGFKPSLENKSEESPNPKTSFESLLSKIKFEEPSSLLPPGYKPNENKSGVTEKSPPQTAKKTSSLLAGIKFEEPAGLLPPGYKPKESAVNKETSPKPLGGLLSKIKFEEPSDLLPPGYKPKTNSAEKNFESLLSKAKPVNVSSQSNLNTNQSTTVAPKIVLFPAGRPGTGTRKPFGRQTTEKPGEKLLPDAPKIQKGWPVRATTAFTGWPTPPTTPISIEKLLEQARLAATSTASLSSSTSTSTTTTTTTTTTPRPTTPGMCEEDCELVGVVKLVGGVRWVPELLDRNTREWQELANEVESQLDEIYSKSEALSRYYKKIRIDSFNKGSVVVDYFVELENTGNRLSTKEMKKLFHDTLTEVTIPESSENGTISDNYDKLYKMGRYVLDPKYTDFIVVQRQVYPTVGYADDDNFLPQWAIAVIVIGLASLLFVIIFGVTVMVNRHKNNRKRNPTPLTEDIINEMNKHNLSGLDNFGADDLYGMDDVWNERGYEKPSKKRSHGSFADNSMTNLYDSWRSDWNGYEKSYGGSGYGYGQAGSAGAYGQSGQGGYGYAGRRRSDYDTNF